MTSTASRVSTGIAGLDEILGGGLIARRAYVASGGPGAGKTTLGFHFLAAGQSHGETTLLISLVETADTLQANAASMAIDLSQVHLLDLSPTSQFFVEGQAYDIFSPAEVDRDPLTQRIVEQVLAIKPHRVFLDSMTQLRYLTEDKFQFRQQVLSFLRFLTEQGATVLFSSESTASEPDDDLRFMSDGVLVLDATAQRRSLQVTKCNGTDFAPGRHSLRLSAAGMAVFPRLLPKSHQRAFVAEQITSGLPALDHLLGGGLERGTTTILTGPSGVGKTTIGAQFMKEAASRGERSVIYSFEEGVETILQRCEAVNIPALAMVEQGNLALTRVEPLLYTPDEFAALVRVEVEQRNARIVMIDSVAGYRLTLQGDDLATHLHALCTYLKNMGVTVILTNEVETITGDFRATEAGISHMADNVVFMRYIEYCRPQQSSEMRRIIGVLKKRLSDFDKTLSEFQITAAGVQVGVPVVGLRGVLRGTPEWIEAGDDRQRHG